MAEHAPTSSETLVSNNGLSEGGEPGNFGETTTRPDQGDFLDVAGMKVSTVLDDLYARREKLMQKNIPLPVVATHSGAVLTLTSSPEEGRRVYQLTIQELSGESGVSFQAVFSVSLAFIDFRSKLQGGERGFSAPDRPANYPTNPREALLRATGGGLKRAFPSGQLPEAPPALHLVGADSGLTVAEVSRRFPAFGVFISKVLEALNRIENAEIENTESV